MAANQTCEEPIAYVSEEFLGYTWNINYWTSFILTWCGARARAAPPPAHRCSLTHHGAHPCFPRVRPVAARLLAPFLQSYTLSGAFTVRGRLWDSVKENVILYSILGALGAIGLIYIGVAYQMDLCVPLWACAARAGPPC